MKRASTSHLLSITLCVLAGALAAVVGPEAIAKCQFVPIQPPIPDPVGPSGAFVGISNGALLVAGGTSFPARDRAEGHDLWSDNIAVLEADADNWRTGFKLPHSLAYGVSITSDLGLICLGGCDSRQTYRSVLALAWIDGRVAITQLPDLPAPRASAAGARLGNTIYIAGGQAGDAEGEATKTFWRLALPGRPAAAPVAGRGRYWEKLLEVPGAPRAEAVAIAHAGRFYLFSGWDRTTGPDGKPKRRYLNDAYCFDPATARWQRIADVPKIGVAAAPACSLGDAHVLVFGGNDGVNDHLIPPFKGHRPRYSRDVLAYHTITDTWVKAGKMPVGQVATQAVPWRDRIVIPGGQTGPRRQTNQIYLADLSQDKPAFGALNSVVLTIYLCTLVAMGFYFSRQEKTTTDFFLGGRHIPWWAVGVSIFGTQLSSISFMAIPAKAYDTDWSYFIMAICIVLVQPIVVFFYLPFFRRLNVTSAYEYLENRFNVAVRLFGSALFVLFQTGRMTIVLFLPSLALTAVTGISIYTCIVVMGVLATVYTALGGIKAVVWTDLLQVLVLVGGVLASLGIILCHVDGGWNRVMAVGLADGKFNWANLSWDYTQPVLWVIVVGSLFQNMVSYTADQAVIQRYLTTRNEKRAAWAIWTNAAVTIPVTLIWFMLGTSLYVFYKSRPELLDPALKTDQIFPQFIAQQLPTGVTGLVIAGLFAASMSTIDSSLNSIATVLVTDFYRRFRPTATDRSCLRLARWLTVLLGTVATGTALWMAAYQEHIRSLWDAYMTVLGLLMGSLAGLFALGIFTRRGTGTGALLGAFGGAATLLCVQLYTDICFYLYAGIGIASCFVIGYVSSRLLPSGAADSRGLTSQRVS